jgi:hypothetical protein
MNTICFGREPHPIDATTSIDAEERGIDLQTAEFELIPNAARGQGRDDHDLGPGAYEVFSRGSLRGDGTICGQTIYACLDTMRAQWAVEPG